MLALVMACGMSVVPLGFMVIWKQSVKFIQPLAGMRNLKTLKGSGIKGGAMAKAGNFKIHARDPYPVWIDIKYGEDVEFTIHHKELSDLEYAVKKAKKEAKEKLPEKYKDEV
jgi:hypothetical protein